MTVLLYISIFIGVFYCFLISTFVIGFLNLKPFKKNTEVGLQTSFPVISVLVPVKNEKENIPNLIKNLNKQSLNPNLFELIIINDNSTDGTSNVTEQLIKGKSNYKFVQLLPGLTGKKKAIQKGISEAAANIIVTTDADCTHNKKWLETILNYYTKHKPKMLIAPVLMQGKSFFGNMQSLEFMSLIASTAGSTGIGHPIMCNGANLSYEKKVYEEFTDALNMKKKSGDDIFLLHNIKKKYPKEIHFLKSNDAVVYTKAEKSLKSFFRQRVRWASKSSSYKDSDSIISSLIVLLTNLVLIVLYILSIFDIAFLPAALVLTMLKIIPDLILILLSAGYFKIKKLIAYFPVTMTVYPFYIVITGVAGLFTKKISWK